MAYKYQKSGPTQTSKPLTKRENKFHSKMFRTEIAVIPRLFSVTRRQPKAAPAPPPADLFHLPPPSPSLSWLASAFDALSAAHSDVAALVSPPLDPVLATVYLDHTTRLLDLCNSVFAEIEKLRRRRLLLHFALHLLRSERGPRSPETTRRARDSLRDSELSLPVAGKPSGLVQSAAALVGDLKRRVPPGKVSAEVRSLWRTMASLDRVAAALAVAAAAILAGEESPAGKELCFLSDKGRRAADEVVVVEDAARSVAGMLGKEVDGGGTVGLDDAVKELERAKEKWSEGVERLHDGVKGLFNAVVGTRNVLLGSYRSLLEDPSAFRKRKHFREIF